MKIFKSIYFCFVSWVVKSFYPLSFFCTIKSALLRSLGCKIGNNLFIHENVFISNPNKLIIKDDCVISRGVILIATGEIEIGNRVMIGYDSKILSSSHIVPEDKYLPIRFAGHTLKKVIIEDDAWIASNVIITQGVTIGKGSIIAAGAVVLNDIPPYTVHGGIPAKFIKNR